MTYTKAECSTPFDTLFKWTCDSTKESVAVTEIYTHEHNGVSARLVCYADSYGRKTITDEINFIHKFTPVQYGSSKE